VTTIELSPLWLLALFAALIAASYVGTTLALRSYFGGEDLRPSEVIRVGDDDGG
jgi:hypothetical protein